MKTIAFIHLVICSIALVKASCYRYVGCADLTTSIEYEGERKWTPASDPCYTCKCYSWKKPVVECVEVADIVPVKKSTTSFSANFDISFVTGQEIEVFDEAANITCSPLPLPAYDIDTGFKESVTYKNVYYYVTMKETVCCESSATYYRIDPSCEEISIDGCKSKVVKKDNHDELCDKPYGVLG